MKKPIVWNLALTFLLIWACNDAPFDYPNEGNSIKGKIHVGMWTKNDSTQLSFNYPNWSKPITIDFIYCEDQCESMSTIDDKTWKSIVLNGINTQVSGEIEAASMIAAIRDPYGNIRTNKEDIGFAIPYQYLLRTGHRVIQWPDPQTGRSTLWMIGGYDSYSYLNDCWKSEDGLTWTLVTNNAAFSPRAYHGLVHMPDPNNGNKETMWIIGGSQDRSDYEVWKSTDGNVWEPVCKYIIYSPGLRNFQIVTMPDPSNGNKQTMWMIGGELKWFGPVSGVMKSIDGVIWNFADQTNPFPARYGHQVVSMPDPANNYKNTLWIIGGIGKDGNYLDDIWKSVDGSNWSKVLPKGSFFGSRFGHQVVVMEEDGRAALWLIGGFSSFIYSGDVWKSYDGITWLRTANKILSKVAFHNAVVMKDPFEAGNSVLISGGETEYGEVIIEQRKTHDGIHFRTPNVLEFVF